MENWSDIKLSLYSWALFPVYAWQGIKVRGKVERLHPAKVAHDGLIGKGKPKYRLLVIGDSTIEGLSLENLEDIFAHQIAATLHARTSETVYWRRAGANSATAGDIRDHIIPHIDDRNWTHIILAVGTNDTKNFHSVNSFKKNFGTLLYAIRSRFPTAKVIWTPVADTRKFPALPTKLAHILRARAELINRMGQILCEERGAIYSEPVPIEDASGFARDGFHAGPLGNQIWAAHLIDYIVDLPART